MTALYVLSSRADVDSSECSDQLTAVQTGVGGLKSFHWQTEETSQCQSYVRTVQQYNSSCYHLLPPIAGT